MESLPSAAGVFFTVLLYFVVGGYTLQKCGVMITRKGVESMSVEKTSFYPESYIFDLEQGLDIAVAFTDINSEREYSLDPSFGSLLFAITEWVT